MIARRERDDLVLRRTTRLGPVLTGELQGRLHRFGAAREEVQLVEIAGERGRQLRRELLGRLMRERAAAEVGDLARLARQRVRDLGHAVADVHDEGAAAGVEVAPAPIVVEVAALRPHDPREAARQLPIEDVTLGVGEHRHGARALRSFRISAFPRSAARPIALLPASFCCRGSAPWASR